MDGEWFVCLVGFYACAFPTPPKHSQNVFPFTCLCEWWHACTFIKAKIVLQTKIVMWILLSPFNVCRNVLQSRHIWLFKKSIYREICSSSPEAKTVTEDLTKHHLCQMIQQFVHSQWTWSQVWYDVCQIPVCFSIIVCYIMHLSNSCPISHMES